MIATAGADDVDYVRGLGAALVVDHRAARFEEVTGPVDVVIDTVGGDVQRRSFSVLARGGVLVSIVSEPDAGEAARHGVHATFLLVKVTTAHLARIAALLDDGSLTTRIGTVLPLSEARSAHEMLDGSRARPRGKIVLRARS